MPAAAVIPAPVAYIKAVAVKKLVVGYQCVSGASCRRDVCLAVRVSAGSQMTAGRICNGVGVCRRPFFGGACRQPALLP